jgi:hypothetical protein
MVSEISLTRANNLQRDVILKTIYAYCPNCLSSNTLATRKHKIFKLKQYDNEIQIYSCIHKCLHCNTEFIVNHRRIWVPYDIEPLKNDMSDYKE